MKISQDGKQWEGAKQNYSKSSPFFVADCGLCGTDMQEEVKTRLVSLSSQFEKI